MTNMCLSGGAKGSDLLFGACAEKVGHTVVHFHFDRKRKGWKNHYILTDTQLEIADPFLEKANLSLQRKWPCGNIFTNNLLRRNYYQILKANSLYAVSHFENGRVAGGTAWAVQMFIDKFDKGYTELPCYVFCQNAKQWYVYTYVGWIKAVRVPKPAGIYAGVGSRDLLEVGQQAIIGLYK